MNQRSWVSIVYHHCLRNAGPCPVACCCVLLVVKYRPSNKSKLAIPTAAATITDNIGISRYLKRRQELPLQLPVLLSFRRFHIQTTITSPLFCWARGDPSVCQRCGASFRSLASLRSRPYTLPQRNRLTRKWVPDGWNCGGSERPLGQIGRSSAGTSTFKVMLQTFSALSVGVRPHFFLLHGALLCSHPSGGLSGKAPEGPAERAREAHSAERAAALLCIGVTTAYGESLSLQGDGRANWRGQVRMGCGC